MRIKYLSLLLLTCCGLQSVARRQTVNKPSSNDNKTKRMMNKFFVLTIALIVGSGLISACSATRSNGGDSAGNALTAQNQIFAAGNQANAKETPQTAKPIDIFAAFKKGDDYKTTVRPKIFKDGWQPARTAEGEETCQSSAMEICKEYPELNSGPASGLGNIEFRWKKADKILLVFTVDDPPVYDSYEFEKTPETNSASTSANVSGKYSYKYTEDYGGEISFDFKPNGKLDYEWSQEDVTWKGDGNWKWNEAEQILTATVFTEPEAETAAESEKTPPRKEIFVFQKKGNDLKLVKSPSGMDAYKGKVFQKR